MGKECKEGNAQPESKQEVHWLEAWEEFSVEVHWIEGKSWPFMNQVFVGNQALCF